MVEESDQQNFVKVHSYYPILQKNRHHQIEVVAKIRYSINIDRLILQNLQILPVDEFVHHHHHPKSWKASFQQVLGFDWLVDAGTVHIAKSLHKINFYISKIEAQVYTNITYSHNIN